MFMSDRTGRDGAMQFDRSKLREAILYACEECPPELLGAVKLHKVLYFTDMLRYAATGRPFTGAEYRKRPFGPTCTPLLATLRTMERDGELAVSEADYFGLAKKEYRARRPADRSRFAAGELALFDEVIDFVCRRNSARTISEISHQLPWELAEFGEVIGYDTALMLVPDDVTPEALELVEGEARIVEAARSNGSSMGGRTYRAFRSRVLSEARAGRA